MNIEPWMGPCPGDGAPAGFAVGGVTPFGTPPGFGAAAAPFATGFAVGGAAPFATGFTFGSLPYSSIAPGNFLKGLAGLLYWSIMCVSHCLLALNVNCF